MQTKFPLTDEKILQEHVKFLSENNRTFREEQEKIVNYIVNKLTKNGIPAGNIEFQVYAVDTTKYKNIIVHFKESERNQRYIPRYVIGAHYDAYGNLPGADDNASAVAGLLEISRVLNETKFYNGRDIDIVFYSTEEPPFYGTRHMGSFHHAESIKNENVKLAIILEMIGYFSEEKNSQKFPLPFLKYIYPTTGNFIAIVANFSNLATTRKVKGRFNTYLKKNNLITVESINAPAIIPGIDLSDHRNYWKFNIPAVMVTDTAFYRNENYHTRYDTYETLNYRKMKEVVDAVIFTVLSL
jgi:Zn-dependent M28 family amino/carboxypeptidase